MRAFSLLGTQRGPRTRVVTEIISPSPYGAYILTGEIKE